ncbi:MAG: PAS domain S-box protein [Ignavibacteriaceae bacterium]
MKKKSTEKFTSSKKTEKKITATKQTSKMENHSIEKNDLSTKTIEAKDTFIMLEDSLAANFITIPSGKLVYCNKAFLDLFGFKTSEEALNYPVQKLYPSTAARENFLNELKKNKKLHGFEAVHVAIDGRIIHTLENMIGVFDDKGELVKIMGNIIDISERKNTEKALLESENKYRDLIELAVDGILLGSHEGIIIGANSQMQKLSGRTSDELIGQHVRVLFDPDELKTVPLRFDLLNKGEIVFSERSIIRPDGKAVPIEMHTKMMPNGTYQSIYRDVTERKTADKALKESEEIYRKTFYLSPVAINIIRLKDGMRVSINDHFTKVMGYTESEIIGKTTGEFDFLVNPEDREKLVEGLKKDGIIENLEAQFRKKNGEIVYGLMAASILELDGVPHIISITKDITERKHAEEALQQSESKLQAIFSAMTDVILVVDSDGRYLEIAPSNSSLLYKPPQELLGKTMHEVFPKEQADFFLSRVKACLSSRQVVRMEYTLEIDRKNFWFAAILSPLNSNSVLLVARDVTETKLAEENLKISDATYRGILNTINDAIYIQDRDGTFLDVNEGAVRMYGYTREELIGKNPLFVSAEGKNDIQKVVEQVQLAFEGIPQEFEFWGKRKNGQIFPKIVRIYKGLYFGKVVCIAVAQDVTEKKQVVQTLKASEERYKSLFSMFRLVADNSEDLLWAKDLDNKYIFANKTMCEKLLCAKDTDEPIGKDDLFFATRQREAHPENPEWHTFGEICANTDEVILKEKTAKQFDEYGNVKGKFIFLDVRKAPIWDFDGKMIGVVGTARDVTKEKALEKESAIASEKLKENEELFRNLIENITDVFYIADEQGKMKYCSPNFFTFTGYAPEEIIGFVYTRVVHPADRKKVVEHYTNATNSGVLDTNIELRVQRKDGSVFWAGQNTRIVRDEKGNVLEYRTVARDINQQKNAEEELRISEERFRLISNLTSDYVFSTKIKEDGKVELDWVMGAFEKISGYTVEEYKAIGGWYGVVHPDDREKDLTDFKKLLNNEKVVSVVRTIHKNGTIVWTRSYASPIWDEERNKLIGIYGGAQDITEQKLAEEELRKSELHFRSVWENAASGMRLTDENGIIISVNNAFCELVGKPKEELVDFNLSVMYSVQHSNKVENEYLERFNARGVKQLIENEFILWNEKTYWFRVISSFIESEREKPLLLSVFTDITEQKLSEVEIKKLSQAVEQSAGSITITDINGNIEYVNKKFEEVTGYSYEEVKGKSTRILKSGLTSTEDYKKMWDTIKAGNEWRGTFHNKKKDGSLYWEATTISPMKNSTGKITNFLAIKDDITQDKIKEDQLMMSELHFRSIWENSLDGMRLADENGIIVSVNDAFARLFEKDKNEINGKDIAVVYGEDSGFNDVTTFVNRFKDRTIQPFMERDITLWNGKPMSVELTNSFIEIEGQPPLLLSIFNNVTERVQNERLLKESNEFNTSLLKNAPFGMDIVNEDGTILFQSDNLKTLFSGDAVGKKCWESYSEDKIQCNDCPLKSEIVVGKTSRIQKGNLIAGRTFEIFHTGINFQGKKALLETFMDVSSQKEAELEITAAKEKAEEANKVKTNFLENMSHELRTPMIPILGFTELMSAMELPDEVKSMATMMNKSANRLMDTLNIILDLAQIEKERVLLKPASTNLNKTVEEVCGLFQPIAKERNLYLRSEFSTDAITVTTDERILRHAINNLINNGLKFTQKGGVTIKLSTQKSGDQNFALIQVCDTGIGIPKDKQNIIWEEFRQASEGIGRSFEGNGLGLTITKNFIEQLKGEVWVESEIGKGSIFNIKLPDVESVEEKKVTPREPETPVVPILMQEPPVEMSSLKKVLYVEDEEISFSVVKHFLKNKVSLDWARSGQDGVVMAKGNKYNAILMDINLAKGIDGMQTTKLIRELPQYQNIPIIAITAFAMRGDKEEFLGAGCSHYISKPFTKAALLTLMGEALGEKVE